MRPGRFEMKGPFQPPTEQRLTDQDLKDAAKVRRAVKRLRAGKLKTVTHETLKRRLA